MFEVFEDLQRLYIVMEYAPSGDLLHYVKSKGRLGQEEARVLFKQIIYGLAHIHARGVLHRDVKLDNIFLDQNNRPKLGDFGVSRFMANNSPIKEQCGTPAYLAPEVIRNQVLPSPISRATRASMRTIGA